MPLVAGHNELSHIHSCRVRIPDTMDADSVTRPCLYRVGVVRLECTHANVSDIVARVRFSQQTVSQSFIS